MHCVTASFSPFPALPELPAPEQHRQARAQQHQRRWLRDDSAGGTTRIERVQEVPCGGIKGIQLKALRPRSRAWSSKPHEGHRERASQGSVIDQGQGRIETVIWQGRVRLDGQNIPSRNRWRWILEVTV
jgi:hypothetical protein